MRSRAACFSVLRGGDSGDLDPPVLASPFTSSFFGVLAAPGRISGVLSAFKAGVRGFDARPVFARARFRDSSSGWIKGSPVLNEVILETLRLSLISKT